MSADRKMDEDSGIAAGQQMSFLRFPTEIQMQILSQLCYHCTQEPKCPETTLALHNCSLVCKSWRAITVPLMWHQLSLSGNRRVKVLTGLFSEKPQLSKHVESIRWDLLDDPGVARDVSLMQTARTLGMIVSPPGPDYFLLPYPYRCESNLILGMQVLLAVTDKIKNLSLRGMWTSGHFKYLANRQGQRGMRCIFPELRSVLISGVPSPCRACWYDYGHEERRHDCRFLLQTAPKLHTLELYGMGVSDLMPMDESAASWLRQPLPTHLRNIRFCNSVFLGNEDQEHFLRPLIEHCAALERFTMQLWVCYCLLDAVRITRLVSPGDLVDMLETQKNSLKYLELNYLDPHDKLYYINGDDSDEAASDEAASDEAASLGQITTNAWYASPNLASFPALEELHIDEHSFCHHWQTPSQVEDGPQTCLTDIISPSLQRLLVLVGPKSRAWGDIRHFCNQVARGRYPNLQRLNIVFHVSRSDCRIPDFLQAPDKVPQAMMFRTKARAVKHLLEATNVVFGAAVLAHDTCQSVTKVFRSLSDDMEEWLGIETIEPPFMSQEVDGAPEVCGN
ncbi:hypothetical protein MANI_021041 [Metarhizium anisopliae]|nr:hypothetical protein MANI_021041 [Metarhizium anisopliae]